MNKIIPVIISALLAVNSYAALIISNSAATTITTTSMYFNAIISSTNGSGTNPTCTVFYGTVDYTTNANSWAASNVYGVAGLGNISTQITGLSASHKYYFAWRATEGSSTDWATPSLNAWTKPTSPTSTPAVVTISVQTDTNAILKSPTNFFGANKALMNTALASYGFLTNEALWIAASNGVVYDAETNGWTVSAHSAWLTNEPAFTNWLGTNTLVDASVTNAIHAQVTNEIAVRTASNATIQAQVAVLNTNTFPLQSGLNVSNRVGVLETNTATAAQGALADSALQAEIDDLGAVVGRGFVADGIVVKGIYAYNTNDAPPLSPDNDGRITAEGGFYGDGANITGITAAQVGAVATNAADYLSIIRSMTNYVAVASATNYLTYDPATRLLTGCVTNSGGGLASDWSAYPATQTVAMASNILDNVSALRLSQFGQLHEKLETKNIIVQGNTLSRLGQYTSLTMTNPPSGTPMNFLVLSALSRTNIFLNDPEDFDNCLVLSRASQDGRNYVGINEAPASQGEATTAYALTVKGGTRLDTANVGTLTTTNLQVTGGATNGGILYATNALGQLGMLGGLSAYAKLFVNAGGTAPEYVAGSAAIDKDDFSINITNATGYTTTVTNGFRPSYVLFFACISATPTVSIGFDDLVSPFCINAPSDGTGSTGVWGVGGGIAVYAVVTTGNTYWGRI
ncbi:MAG: hypothetical protein L6455_14660, partial [Kiritimatiellae bacterium]|nr:hypothetical protein [Kiritimatiellia bacterium]